MSIVRHDYSGKGSIDDLQLSSGSQVIKKYGDVAGYRWWSGQMSSGGLESVLIGNIVDGVYATIIADVRVTSAGNDAAVLDCGSDFLQVSALVHNNSVVGLEAREIINEVGNQ